jgi:hypothetical protein
MHSLRVKEAKSTIEWDHKLKTYAQVNRLTSCVASADVAVRAARFEILRGEGEYSCDHELSNLPGACGRARRA